MNYPFRKNTPVGRLLCLMLVLLLTIGSLSGCSLLSSVQPTEPSSDPTESTLPISLEPSTEPSSAPTVPPTTEEPKENVAVIKEQLNMRDKPSTGSRVVGTLDAGEEVEVLRIELIGPVQWAYVSSETLNMTGWIVADMLDLSNVHLGTSSTVTPASTDPTITPPTHSTIPTTPTSPTTTTIDPITGNGTGTTTPANGKQGVVTASELNIRASADKAADRKGSYKYGDRITVLESSNGWGRTDKGWVSLTYVYMDGDTGKNTASGTVTATQLIVRSGPGQNYDRLKTLAQNERVQILEQIKIGASAWGYTNGGWVSMDYIRLDSGTNIGGTGTGTGTTTTGNATVTGSTVNVRSGAGTNYPVVATVTSGQSITILETATGTDGNQWGRTSQGWVSMAYISMNTGTNIGGGAGTGTTATVTGSAVNIRSGAGTNYPVVGSVSMGQSITILETAIGTDGNQWGRTSLGWISMAYVRMN